MHMCVYMCLCFCMFLHLGHDHSFGREEENGLDIVLTLQRCHICDFLCIRLWIIP